MGGLFVVGGISIIAFAFLLLVAAYIDFGQQTEKRAHMVLNRVLKKGCKGADVVNVQMLLIDRGYYIGEAGADGWFWKKTQSAVKAFQKAMGLIVDGKVGKNTLAKLEKDTIQILHFSDNEFRCHHCGKLPKGGIDPSLIILLERIRSEIGDNPITISSGYRCLLHNIAVGGAQPKEGSQGSQHLYGRAADIRVRGMETGAEYESLYRICDELNPNGGVGYYPTSKKSTWGFVHVDVRGKKSRW
jgi:hypothetical protein